MADIQPVDVNVGYGASNFEQQLLLAGSLSPDEQYVSLEGLRRPKGNDYRLVVAVAYRFAALFIKFVGTHAEYDAIDASTVENLP